MCLRKTKAGKRMVKFLTAYTRDADDPKKAVREIKEQLCLEKEGLANSIVLLFCYIDFIESNVVRALGESLPCEVVGCTSLYFALPGAADAAMLTAVALTSDDTEFVTGLSGPLTAENADERTLGLYRQTAATLDASGGGAKPSMIFALQPIISGMGADVLASALDRACGEIPVFGTYAIDMGQNIRSPKTIYRGEAYDDRMVLLFLRGRVKPRFFSFPFPRNSFFSQDAVITSARGSLITTINNKPAVSFLEELGLTQKGSYSVSSAIPLVVDYRDGTLPQILIVQNISPEGNLICTRNAQAGGVLNIGTVNREYVLESAKALIQEIRQTGSCAGVFIFSCMMRNVALGGNAMAEIDMIQKELAGFSGSYLLCYSGGELCPRPAESGGTRNTFEQYALIACQL
jgi:hypothetical protein